MSKTRTELHTYLSHRNEKVNGITAEYVVAHAARQSQRKRNPSVAYKGILNPRKALDAAKSDIAEKTKTVDIYAPYQLGGSVLAWVRDQDPERRTEAVAIEHLTDAPAVVRSRFIDELSQEYTDGNVAETFDKSRAMILSNLGYMAGYYEPAGYRQRVYQAWQETEVAFEHPVFGDTLVAHDAAIIAPNN